MDGRSELARKLQHFQKIFWVGRSIPFGEQAYSRRGSTRRTVFVLVDWAMSLKILANLSIWVLVSRRAVLLDKSFLAKEDHSHIPAPTQLDECLRSVHVNVQTRKPGSSTARSTSALLWMPPPGHLVGVIPVRVWPSLLTRPCHPYVWCARTTPHCMSKLQFSQHRVVLLLQCKDVSIPMSLLKVCTYTHARTHAQTHTQTHTRTCTYSRETRVLRQPPPPPWGYFSHLWS